MFGNNTSTLYERILKIQENKKNIILEGFITARINLRSTKFNCASSKHNKYNFWIKFG